MLYGLSNQSIVCRNDRTSYGLTLNPPNKGSHKVRFVLLLLFMLFMRFAQRCGTAAGKPPVAVVDTLGAVDCTHTCPATGGECEGPAAT